MKRQPLSRNALARHEAGHVLAIALLGRSAVFSWRRFPRYELAHVEAAAEGGEEWEDPQSRGAIIARRVVAALAGGAAERCHVGTSPDTEDLAAIFAWTGAVDFELAHEWLTLQRYDGDQQAIMVDLSRLFTETVRLFELPENRRALTEISGRILTVLETVDRDERSSIELPAELLTKDLRLEPAPRFALQATIAKAH